MNTQRIRTRKTALAVAATLALLPMQDAVAATCTWNTTIGNWNALINWAACATGNGNPAGVPGAADTATIGAAGVVQVNTGQQVLNLNNAGQLTIDAFGLNLVGGGATTNTGVMNIGGASTANLGVSAGHNMNNTGGVINIANGSVVNQFGSTITGGTINTTGTGKVAAFANAANFLTGVTLNGSLDMLSNLAFERVNGGFTLNGSVSLGANSILSFEGNQTVNGNGTITFADANGSNRLDVGGGNLVLASGMAIRGGNGVIGQQNFSGGAATLTNQGLISADSSGRSISIGVNGVVNNQAIMEAQNGGTLVLNAGGGYNNAGGTLRAGNGSVLLLNSASVTGGTLDNTGTGSLRASASNTNFLNGTTLTGVLDLASAVGFVRVASGGMVINGTVNIGSNSIYATEGAQTLSGSGNIVFADSNGLNRFDVGGGSLTLGSGLTVRGGNGIIGTQNFVGGPTSLTNNGTIQADVAGRSITLAVNGLTTNNGTLAALNGGTLNLNTGIVGTSGSQIVAGAGSIVNQNAITISGNMNIVGTGSFRPNASAANFLDGVTLNGTLDLLSAVGFERITNGLTLNNATVNIGANSIFAPQGNQTIGGTGSIVFADGNGNNRFDVGAGTLTLASGVTVSGGNGIIGTQNFSGGAAALVNNGTIQADVAARAITLQVNGLTTNNGTLAALNGGTLNLNSAIVGNTGSQIVAGAGSQVNQNSITISGNMNIVGTGSFRPNASASNFLDGVTLSGTLDMLSGVAFERITNGLTLNNGTVNIGANSIFAPQGNQTIGGTGNIVFADGNGNNRFDVGAGTLTLASGVTVHGGNGIIGTQNFVGGAAGLINQGVINADVSGRTITMQVNGVVTNQGTMGAQGGGTLALSTGGGYDNTAGTMFADNGGTVLINAATVTGGNLNSAGSGVFRPNASSSNFINGVTLNGVLDMVSTQGIVRVNSGGMVINGTLNIGANSIFAPQGNQTISGSGSIVFADGNGSNRFDVGGGNLVIGSGVTVRGQNGIIGQQNFAAGTATLTNNGTLNADAGGTITANINGGLINNGTFRAQNGTLTVQDNLTGTGTLRADATGILNLANGGNTQGTLTMGGVGSVLNIGTGNLTLNSDYTNVAAGTGNSFNRRAGVSGAGLIVAGANAAQAITGASVSNGNTTNASLAIGNVRVNTPTPFSYQVANTGSTGPTLRGAIQTSVNSANISDGRLGGSGVTPANYAAALGGNSGDLVVNFNTAIAGPLAALTGQVLNLRSNFENIADQKLNIVLAPGAAAFNVAVGSVTPAPTVTVANQRVGGSNTAALTVANTAAAGSFSEDLNASFGANGGAASNNGGSISGLLAGANNNSAMTVGVTTGSAGAKTGTVTLNYQTAGAVNGVSNGLGVIAANGPQVLTVNGNVYLVAQPAPAVLPSTVNLGNFRAGAGAQAAPGIVIVNTNIAPTGFQEGLAAAVLSVSGQATGTGFTNAVAGGNGTLNVGLSGVNAGANTGSVNVQLRSNGIATTGDTGLGNLDLGAAQTITVNANGYRLAQPNAIAPINFGNVLANSVQTRTLTISNNATADGFSEALNAAFGVVGGTNAASFSGAGAINGLLAGASNNTSMVVTLNTSSTGAKSANVQVLLDSNGTAIGNGLGITALPTQVINLDGLITANVGNLATAGLNPTTVNFGKFREGAPNQTQQLTVSNLTVGSGEGLNASFGAATGGASNNAGIITSLAPGGSNSTSMSVTLSGLTTAGAKSGTQVLNFASDGTFNGGTITPLQPQSVSLSAEVYRLAAAGGSSAVALAARRVGDAAASGTLTLSNSAANDGFSEGLRGTFGAAPAGFAVSGAANTALIAAGSNEARTVSLATGTAGNFSGNVVIGLVSNGAGTSGFGDLALADKTVALSGKVYTPAVGQLATPTVDFGVVRVGDTVSARNITINNTAAVTALNDTLTANLSGVVSPFSGGGSASGIGPQGSGQIGVGLATTTAGVFNVNASVAFTSRNPDMADASAGANAGVNILAQINNLANADFDFLSGLGLLTQNGSDYVLDLGNIALGSSIVSRLQLDNDVLGPADDLSGNFDTSAADDFSYLGWGSPVGPLAAGQATGELEIDYLASTLGQFQDSIVFNGRGTNASDQLGREQTRRLIIRANVIDPNGNPVPEPGSMALMLAAAVAGLIAKRRRAH